MVFVFCTLPLMNGGSGFGLIEISRFPSLTMIFEVIHVVPMLLWVAYKEKMRICLSVL